MSEQIILTRLRDIRTQIGLTQDDVARMADITTRTVQRLEAGHPTTVSTAKSISAALMLPSYNELTLSMIDQEQGERSVGSISEQLNNIRRQLKVIKDLLITHRATWISIFSAVMMLYLTVPSGPWGKDYGVPIVLCLIGALLPTITMLVLTYEPEPPEDTHRFSVKGAALVCAVSAIGTMFSVWFAVISFGVPLTGASFLHVMNQPIPPSWLDTLSDLHGLPWAVSFVVTASSLAIMVWLVHWLRARNVHFSRFSPSCAMFILILFVSGLALESVLLDKNPWLAAPMSAVLILFSVVLVIFMEQKSACDWSFLRVSVISGMGLWLIASIAMQAVNVFITLNVMFYRSAELSSEHKVAYCNTMQENEAFCWDVRLLEQEGIAINTDNLTLLMARNGQSLSLMYASSALKIDESRLKNQEPFPDAFYQLISEGYSRLVSHAVKHGYLYDIILLAQVEKENDEGKKYLSELEFKLGGGVEEFVHLIQLAKTDKQAFVRAFESSHPVMKMNSDLVTLNYLATGKYTTARDEGRHNYYVTGKASYWFKKSNGEQVDSKASLSDVEAIMKIPLSKFPAI